MSEFDRKLFLYRWLCSFLFLVSNSMYLFWLEIFYRLPSTTIKKCPEKQNTKKEILLTMLIEVYTHAAGTPTLYPKLVDFKSVAILRNCCFKTNKFIHNTKQKPQVTDWCNLRQYWTLCLFNKLQKMITLPLSSVLQLTSN